MTKYNPAFRGADGAYLREEWISVSDIGRTFDGVPLTDTEYERVETAYVDAALAFLREASVRSIFVRGLENYRKFPLEFENGDEIPLDRVGAIVGQVLREKFWCRLEGGNSFIHIGYDYYMYIGVPGNCPAAVRLAVERGLFVELYPSPYKETGDSEE